MKRLAAFWRQRSARSKTLFVVGAAVATLAIIVAVIGPAGDEKTVTTTTTTGSEVLAGQAITCLECGLSSVEESEVDTSRGLHEGPSYAIIVSGSSAPAGHAG